MFMSDKFMVVVIQYEEEHAKSVKGIVDNLSKAINSERGKVQISYQGSDKKIVTAVEKILKLTE